MSPNKLVMMANQIAAFFASQKHGDAAAATADHLQKFWEPRMRSAILAHYAEGGAGLMQVAHDAVARLHAAATAAK